uniref:Serine hydroxymethyltransferase-like domain-containing protein n=1 Tax=Musa acuminata subsp. malaccensis TaxID=214687 RepID=A0A804KWS4_MUSAM
MSPSRSPLGLSPGFRLAACLFPGRQPGSAGAGPVEPSDGKESGEAERGKEEKIRVWESLMRGESAFSILAPSKKAKVEPDLETRRAAVWSRVNQLLSAALSDIFAIMEKEMQFQVYLCTLANFEVYIGSLFPKDPIVELDFPSYGNVSHDYYMPNGKKILGASMFPQGLSYEVNLLIGCIDYDKLEKKDMGLRSQKMLVWKERLYSSREWEFDVCM